MNDLTPEAALDQHFRRAVAALPVPGAPTSVDRSRPVRPGSRLTGDAGAGAVRRAARQPRPRHRGAAAARNRSRLLHHRLVRPRGQRRGRGRAAPDRSRAAALPIRRLLPRPRRQVPGSTPLRDVLQGLVSSVEEPIAGGRHKVFGRKELAVIPQTSTIASHLPRAVGVAFAIDRARKLGVASEWPADAIAVTSFGDASANHSTATGAINAACQAAYQGLPMPVLFVCEDNGLGISVATPDGWIAAAYGDRPSLALFHRRRSGHRGLLRRGHRGRGARAHPTRAGVPAPAGGPLHGARRQRRRDQLSQPGRDRRGLRPRSAARHRAAARRGRFDDTGAVLDATKR